MSTTRDDLDEVTNLRCWLREGGFSPIPLLGKRPVIDAWQTKLQTNNGEIALWREMYPQAINTGILCRTTPCIDIDVLNPDAAAAVEQLAHEHFEEHGDILVRFGRVPKRAILLRTDEPFKKLILPLIAPDGSKDQKIEILADGQQTVVAGEHPETKQPYRWFGGEPWQTRREELPYVREADLRAFLDDAAKVLVEHGYTLKDDGSKQKTADGDDARPDPADWAALIENIRTGQSLHDSICRLAASFVAYGMPEKAAVEKLQSLMNASAVKGTARWQERYDDIPRVVRSAKGKFAGDPADDERHRPANPSLGLCNAGRSRGPIPPRGWLLGNVFCRRFLSSLIASGGSGKTALRITQLIALATGKPITKEHIFQRCRVLLVTLEDDLDEADRRITATLLHHGIDRSELDGWMFVAAPGAKGGKLMEIDRQGRPIRSGLAARLEHEIVANKIDLVCLDPFVKTHSVEENSNSLIDEVVQIIADLAAKYDVAIDAPHHVSKGASDPGNARRSRGASSMVDGMRLVYTLTTMTPEEAQAYGISEAERRLLVRVDSGKVNIAPPMSEAKWFRLVGVNLGNATDLYPSGDDVQTVEPWAPPETFAGLSSVLLNEILTDIEAGLPDGTRYTDGPNATARAAWRVIVKHCPGKSEAMAKKIIKLWVESGLLVKRSYFIEKERKDANGLWIDPVKRPS